MTLTVGTFRASFPAFADTTKYPNAQVDMFIKVYGQLVSEDRWGELKDFGVSLAVAHNLVLEGQSARAAATGGFPGTVTGPNNNKSADKLSTGYDTTVASEQGAGFWNLTTYGARFWHYCQLFGIGPLQLGTPGLAPEWSLAGAWPGPIVGPF